jgi:micrococcal nuclease
LIIRLTNVNKKYDNFVVKVVDGDTIKLASGREIRLLGIDTPEKGQPYYNEAKDFLERLILGKKVRLEKDVTNKDKYGRYLRYVFLKNIFVNVELVRKGYARVIVRFPDVKYLDYLMKVQKRAMEKRLGIWSENN